ncbi:MAG: hypothetical protein NC350_03145, partial [Corallococcus sp.]|nr:hypothetical protein [Corallococcus sp.]
ELSRLTSMAKPTVAVDKQSKKLVITGSGANGYHVDIYDRDVLKDADPAIETVQTVISEDTANGEFDLSALTQRKTYAIYVYAKGDLTTTRDSKCAESQYTPEIGETTYVNGLLQNVSGAMSYSSSLSAHGSPMYQVYDKQGNHVYSMSMDLRFDKTTAKGSLTFSMYNKGNSSDVITKTTFDFTVKSGKWVGEKKTSSKGAPDTTVADYQMEIPFAAALSLDQTKYQEKLGGKITNWAGLEYIYTDVAGAQETVAKASMFDELIGKPLTYTYFSVLPAFNSDGSQRDQSTVVFKATDADGYEYHFKTAFTGFKD